MYKDVPPLHNGEGSESGSAVAGFDPWTERCRGLRTVCRWSRMLACEDSFSHPAVRATLLMDFRYDLDVHLSQDERVGRERSLGWTRGGFSSHGRLPARVDDRLVGPARLREQLVALSEVAWAKRAGGALPAGFSGDLLAFLDDLERYNES